MKSMTSFGRAVNTAVEGNSYLIEIKSVNNRFLDINIRMPKYMLELEEEIKGIIMQKIKRGKVDVYITVSSESSSNNDCVVDFNLAKSYYDCLQKIKKQFGLSGDITLNQIANYQDVITLKPREQNIQEIKKQVFPIIHDALDSMVDMRNIEGNKLRDDIIIKLDALNKNVLSIEKISENFPIDYKKKLEERIKELTSNMHFDQERILTEVAIFADKSAIDEEIVRLKSHISQMKDDLQKDEPIGRKLDFLIQEMNREINTMGSKSSNIELTNLVLENKNILEKIREQVQNIE